MLRLLFCPYVISTTGSGQKKVTDVPFHELRDKATDGAFLNGTQTIPRGMTQALMRTNAGRTASESKVRKPACCEPHEGM